MKVVAHSRAPSDMSDGILCLTVTLSTDHEGVRLTCQRVADASAKQSALRLCMLAAEHYPAEWSNWRWTRELDPCRLMLERQRDPESAWKAACSSRNFHRAAGTYVRMKQCQRLPGPVPGFGGESAGGRGT